ncbi:MAG: hypothetical protein L6Q65_05715 [Zoogloea sp.]|nr:hypothetical protein [Zoogloea sp.]
MNDHAQATRAAFLRAQVKHRRIGLIVRWVGAACRRLRPERPRDPLAGLRLGVELDAAGLAYVAVKRR